MYVCMYVCMYVRTYVCMYVYMHACMYVCLYVRTYQGRSVQCPCVDMPSILMWNAGGVPKTSETALAFLSAMPKIYSRYPLDYPHSRHRSLGESEYDQLRSTRPPTSSSLGGSRYTYGLMTTPFPSSCSMENYMLAPAHSISRRNASKTVSRTN